MSRPKEYSDVTVTFQDGEVKTYRITAGPGIGGFLARDASTTGVLNLFNEDQSWGIPLANIRDWSIIRVEEPDQFRDHVTGDLPDTTGDH